ncbi:MAG: PilZ domain-containing protein [Nitrospirota bacterium]
MKLFRWLKSIKMPIAEEGNRPPDPAEEKVFYPSPEAEAKSKARLAGSPGGSSPPQYLRDKRRYKRYSTEGRNVLARMILSEEVDLANISLGGACILSAKSVTPGDNILIGIADENIDRPLKGKVVWEKESAADTADGRKRHQAGIQFQEVAPYTLIRLKDFMRIAGVPDTKKLSYQYQPSALRFKVYRNRKALMKYPATCPVKKIGLGGMLIETDDMYPVDHKYPMALHLPEEKAPIRFTGRITSHVQGGDERANRYNLGIEFLNLAESDRSRLREFITHL